jgi:hypothetical protein
MTRTSRARALVLGLFVALCSLRATCTVVSLGPGTPGAIHIIIVTHGGSPAGGVRIHFERLSDDNQSGVSSDVIDSGNVVCDANGEASLRSLKPATWVVRVLGSDRWLPETDPHRVVVAAGGTAELRVLVEPRP